MKFKESITIAASAAATIAAVLAFLGPLTVNAVDEADPVITPTIHAPTLASGGGVFKLQTDQETYQAGDLLELKLQASNPTDQPVDATLFLRMTSTRPMSAMSRTLALPEQLWEEQYVVNLQPGEETRVVLKPNAKLPAGKMISITMSDQEQAIMSTHFGVQNRIDLQLINGS